jgi:ribokinase
MKNTITTIGNLTIDDIILYDSKELFLEVIGGDALFSAIGTKIWDANPTIVARIGKNFPKSFAQQVHQIGIEPAFKEVDFYDIRNWALYEPGGARQFINHLSSGTHYQMSITADELPQDCLKADGIHVAPMPTDIQFSIIERIHNNKNKNAIVSWDPNEYYLKQPSFNKMAYEMLEIVDLFLPSREEITAMCGAGDLLTTIKNLASKGPKAIAVKMSTEGTLVYSKEDQHFYHVPIYPSKTIDPTGAGDSFCGGFLASYIRNGDAVESACYGTVAASYVVECFGALNTMQSDLSEKEKRLEKVRRSIKKL